MLHLIWYRLLAQSHEPRLLTEQKYRKNIRKRWHAAMNEPKFSTRPCAIMRNALRIYVQRRRLVTFRSLRLEDSATIL